MKVKTRNFLISFLMLLTLVLGIFAFMPTATTAKAADEVSHSIDDLTMVINGTIYPVPTQMPGDEYEGYGCSPTGLYLSDYKGKTINISLDEDLDKDYSLTIFVHGDCVIDGDLNIAVPTNSTSISTVSIQIRGGSSLTVNGKIIAGHLRFEEWYRSDTEGIKSTVFVRDGVFHNPMRKVGEQPLVVRDNIVATIGDGNNEYGMRAASAIVVSYPANLTLRGATKALNNVGEVSIDTPSGYNVNKSEKIITISPKITNKITKMDYYNYSTAMGATGSSTSNVGVEKSLAVAITPVEPSSKNLTWTSSDPSVVKVSQTIDTTMSGGVTFQRAEYVGLKAGTAIITATADDGSGVSISWDITITGKAITAIDLPDIHKMYVGEVLNLKPTISPADETEGYKWIVPDRSVLYNDLRTKTITAVGTGQTSLYAISNSGEVLDSCIVQVFAKVSEITLSKTYNEMIAHGNWLSFPDVTVLPKNAENPEFEWTTSDSSIVEIYANGLTYRPVGVGTAILTATAKDGSGVKAEYTVVVCESLSNVSATVTAPVGNSLPTVTGVAGGEGYEVKSVVWKDSYGKVASGAFESNKNYTCEVTFAAKTGYIFSSDSVSINGQTVNNVDRTNKEIIATYQFTAEKNTITVNPTGYTVGNITGNVGFSTTAENAVVTNSGIKVNNGINETIVARKDYSATFVLYARSGYSLEHLTKSDIKLNNGTVNSVSYNSSTGALTVNVTLKEIPSTIGAIELTYEGYLGGKSAGDFTIDYSELTGIEAADGVDKIYFVDANYEKISVSTFTAGTTYNVAFKFKAAANYQLPDTPNVTMAGATFKKVVKNGDVYTAYFALPACPTSVTLDSLSVNISGVEFEKASSLAVTSNTQGITISNAKFQIYDNGWTDYTGTLQRGENYYIYFRISTESGYTASLTYQKINAIYNGIEMLASGYYPNESGNKVVRFKIGSNTLSGTVTSFNENDLVTIKLFAYDTYGTLNYSDAYRVYEAVGNSVNYTFENLPTGKYQIRVYKDNHVMPKVDVEVSGATTKDVDVEHDCSATTVIENKAGCLADSVYYACVCGTCYSDANATNKIDDIAAFIASKGGHDYNEEIRDEEHLKYKAANCTEHNIYWYDCTRCDANAKYDPSAAERHYDVTTEKGCHIFTEQPTDEEHLVVGTGINCQSAKEFYYDCAHCDTKGTETWVSTIYGNHVLSENYTQNEDKHYKVCTVDGCEHTEIPENCSGGTKTCKVKAICSTCENEYGELANHTFAADAWKEAIPATCVSTGTKAHKDCSVCERHFDDDDVTEIIVISTVIDETNHDMATEWTRVADGHYYECKRVGCDYHTELQNHNADRPAATEEHAKVCLDCGYIIEAKLGHTCGSGVIQNGQGVTCEADGWKDYYKCSGCEKLYEDEDCTILIADLAAWKTGDGKITSEGHKFGAWVSNGDGTHTRTCSVDNNHKENGTCSGGTQTCTDKAICSTCNTEYGDTLTHSHGSAWETDENNHWNECICGDKANVNAHVDSDSNGKCDTCNYDMPTTPGGGSGSETPEKPDEPKDGLGVGAIIGIVVGAIAVLGGGGFATFWFVIKKKKQ